MPAGKDESGKASSAIFTRVRIPSILLRIAILGWLNGISTLDQGLGKLPGAIPGR